MTHRRVKHTAFAGGDRKDHRLVTSATTGLRAGVGGGQNRHIDGRTTELVIEFVLHVQPDLGHALGDRVIGVADHHRKIMLSRNACWVFFDHMAPL